jgi:hypothetical protein
MRTALGVSIATVALAGDDGPPVPDELIGRLYRSPRHGINELVSGLSTSRRGSLAAFCYSRAHLHDIGLAIAATCDLETLVAAGGRAGNFLFEQSRELPNEEKPRTFSKQAKVSLAPINSTNPSDTNSNVNTASGAQCGGVAEAPVAT